MRVLIIGAGIGGLAAARALRAGGQEVSCSSRRPAYAALARRSRCGATAPGTATPARRAAGNLPVSCLLTSGAWHRADG